MRTQKAWANKHTCPERGSNQRVLIVFKVAALWAGVYDLLPKWSGEHPPRRC